jgi:hypothetical protein
MSNLSRKLMMGAAGAAGEKVYVEDVFSTYLYTGNGSTQTITNGIDLAGEGGLVWIKNRFSSGYGNFLFDTERGVNKALLTNGTNAEFNEAGGVNAFNPSGFSLNFNDAAFNGTGNSYASWTFRKAEKFFDVVTYTGDGAAQQTINHSLGVAPGMIVSKRLDSTSNWSCFHRGIGEGNYIFLNSTNYKVSSADSWINVNSDTFDAYDAVNLSGATYVAYLFAHNAGGFGDAGTDNVISCGSYTGNGSTNGPTIDLGYEPQWLMIKRTNSTGNWFMEDTMRGMNLTGSAYLSANLSSDEQVFPTTPTIAPNATGFQVVSSGTGYNASGSTYIYIAIRRGPMKVPESGTEVFAIDIPATGVADPTYVSGFPVDMALGNREFGDLYNTHAVTRLTGIGRLQTNLANAEVGDGDFTWDYMNGYYQAARGNSTFISWMFRRAPEFFDVVAYTGDGVDQRQVSHNLSAPPEFIITKTRNVTDSWICYHTGLTVQNFSGADYADTIVLNSDVAEFQGLAFRDSTAQTEDYMTLGFGGTSTNESGKNYIAYLFATLAGVSKVGSYTGNQTNEHQIDCGFTTGARFVLAKKVSDTGDWYLFDSARGITTAYDPYLFLNNTDAEAAGDNIIRPFSGGFALGDGSQLNENGSTYIFYAIA